nr:reverse transcriptase domain-containing protein [Tanacetum cinerariifolium]
MGTFRETLAEDEEGALHLGPEGPRVYSDLSSEDKERGLRDSNYDQLYASLKQRKAHANENKMMLDRFTQHIVDSLALMSNVSHQQYYSQSFTTLPSTHGRQNRGQGNNARDTGAAGNGGAQNRVRNVNLDKMLRMQAQENDVVLQKEQLLITVGDQENVVNEDVDEWVAEDVFIKVGTFHFPADFVVIDFDADSRIPLILKRSFLKNERALIDVFKEVDSFLALEDDPTLLEVVQSYLDSEGDILLLESLLNDDPSLVPPKVELKDLPPHIEYTFLEGDDKLPVIIRKVWSVEEKTALITVLKSHKRAIAWKLSDIKGIDPEFCTHKILMEEDFKPTVQHQRRVNPKIYDVIYNEVLKLLDAGLICPISDSPWVSPVYCVLKKGGLL